MNNQVNGVMDEEKRLSELARLKSSYTMYERAKKEMSESRNNLKDQFGNKKYKQESIESTNEIMETMQKDIVEQYIMLGGDVEELKNLDDNYAPSYKTKEEDMQKEINTNDNDVDDYLKSLNSQAQKEESVKYVTYKETNEFDTSKIKEQFDSIPLPSKGEAYANKMSSIPVGYLTAYDENIIVSPNLYRDGTFLDVLLRNKILNPAVDIKNLLPGDRDAIILWLRATGYGNEFPVTVTDDQTGKEFSAVVDLSQINYKEFTLKGDENGWFDYTLPTSKDKIKFSFLTYGEIEELNQKDKDEDLSIKKQELLDIVERVTKYKQESLSKTFNKKFGKRIDDALTTLEEWSENIEVENETKISHSLTNRIIKMIKSVNGITDKKFIREYVVKMNIRDSASLRKYIMEHEPGLDFNIDVERPQNLGGGSMSTFLTLDQFIFLNIA